MSEAGNARAQVEIVAQMQAHGDALFYDYMVSRNWINTKGYNYQETTNDPNNVNYDYLINGSFFNNSNNGNAWAQNIANLWYDPRPPVFIVTNPAYPNNSDFRFWVDINRNGRFETNGYGPTIDDFGNASTINTFLNGEPEFIGVLRDPLHPHSSSNLFIGRYAYLVLPVGKTLDLNNIGNFLKANYVDNVGGPGNVPINTANGTKIGDGFARDQGIGSWELNLAGVLDTVSPWAYEFVPRGYPGYLSLLGPYTYNPPAVGNQSANFGNAFDDAQAMLHYRYEPASYRLAPLVASPGLSFSNYLDYYSNMMDIFCIQSPQTAPFDYTNYPLQLLSAGTYQTYAQGLNYPWPGSYQTNQFFDIQDLFDTNKTSMYFTNRMMLAAERTNTFDRYTFQRLLSVVGMGSSPEYGVWVNGDYNGLGYPNTVFRQNVLRTKVNVNYNNTSQITNSKAPYAAMPTNLVPWTPLGFFTNAAELLLRSQTFGYTNYFNGTTNINLTQAPIFRQFGITNIPIYQSNQPGIRYNASVHRMLQLAANIYDATIGSNYESTAYNLPPYKGYIPPPVRHPSVFRPIFAATNVGTTNVGINIVGYVQVSNATLASIQLSYPFYDMPTAASILVANPTLTNFNIWGVPWVVGANQGLPQFYQYSYQNSVLFERKLLFARAIVNGAPDTNHPPAFTNQFYCMCISNNFGMDAWNPYPTPFTGTNGTTCFISNYITVQFTNNYNQGTNVTITNVFQPLVPLFWAGWQKGMNDTNGFITFLQTNVLTLPPCYYSEFSKQFIFFTNGIISSNGFLPTDLSQKGWPVHNWTLNITNHVVYALFDGSPSTGGALLDFVNLGPFGNSVNIQQAIGTNYNPSNPGGVLGLGSPAGNPWTAGNATDLPGSPMSIGLINQINNSLDVPKNTYYNNLNGIQTNTAGAYFASPFEPSNVLYQLVQYVANDPMVHYTADDLILPNQAGAASVNIPPFPILTNNLGKANRMRYFPWGANDTVGPNMLFKDPQVYGATNWNFPTNKFPGIGWLGRVHRGTPWQTVYLKADTSAGTSNFVWTGSANSWVVSPWFGPLNGEPCPETYPTNDWPLVDLFTATPNDNAATGLLSVNQTNDAAWAAVFAGVIAPTNSTNGTQIMPLNDVSNLVDANAPFTINSLRNTTNYAPNGVFHKVGDILAAAALTTRSPFMLANNNGVYPLNCTDEIVERIPQQTLSLLKVGEPQFVIFAWGQALKPKGPPYLGGGINNGIYTNYDITGEFLTRTVCHLVRTNGLRMVIDSYNVENGSN